MRAVQAALQQNQEVDASSSRKGSTAETESSEASSSEAASSSERAPATGLEPLEEKHVNRKPGVPSHIVILPKRKQDDPPPWQMELLAPIGPIVGKREAKMAAARKPFRATTGMLDRMLALAHLLHTTFVAPSNISNMCRFVSNRHHIIDHVYYMNFAQSTLCTLGAHLLEIHKSFEEHRSGACFRSQEKRTIEEHNIVSNLACVKQLVLAIFLDEFLNLLKIHTVGC